MKTLIENGTIVDGSGRPRYAANFVDYKMFSSKNMPRMITILVPTEEPLGPYGAKSIAEVPINTANPPRSTPSTTPTESAPGNSRCVRKRCPKLSPNEQPQGPSTKDPHDYQNFD